MNKKILIVILIWIVILVCIEVKRINGNEIVDETDEVVMSETLKDGTKLNTSEHLSEVKRVGNLEISKAQLTNKNGKTTLLAEVKNVGTTKIEMVDIEIILLSEQGTEIEKLDGLLGTVQPNQTTQLNASTLGDYTDVYDYKVIIK